MDPQLLNQAGEAILPLLPATGELRSRPLVPGDGGPQNYFPAVAASFTGTMSVDVVMVAGEELNMALAGAAGLTLTDALRPAIEAATAVLGAGILDMQAESVAGELLAGDDWDLVAIENAAGPYAWLALRQKGSQSETTVAPEELAALAPGAAPAGAPGAPETAPATLAGAAGITEASLKLLHEVEMTLTAEIGRTRLPVKDVLALAPGSIIELDRSAGAPADVLVNGRLIARGEIVVVDEDYGIRITEILNPAEAG